MRFDPILLLAIITGLVLLPFAFFWYVLTKKNLMVDYVNFFNNYEKKQNDK